MNFQPGSPSDPRVFTALYHQERMQPEDARCVGVLFETLANAACKIADGDADFQAVLADRVAEFRQLLPRKADAMLRQIGIDPCSAILLNSADWKVEHPLQPMRVLDMLKGVRARLIMINQFANNEGPALN